MNIFVTGGTGFIGRALAVRLTENGHKVTILSRSPHPGGFPDSVFFVQGNPAQQGPWQQTLAESDVVINLAGATIFCRWTKENKQKILASRVQTTANIVHGLKARQGQNTLLINGSAVGFYGFRNDEVITETDQPGSDFLASVCQEWEKTAKVAEQLGVRVALCRFGVVIGKNGGALKNMLPAFRWGLGARLGSGRQWFPWIALDDLLDIFLFIIEHQDISGPVNCTAPFPVTNSELTRALAAALHRPLFFPPVPAFVLRLLLGEFGDFLLNGQRVVPAKLLSAQFSFRFPKLTDVLTDILAAAKRL